MSFILAPEHATCLPEVYGDAAIYFDPRDVKDMANAVQKALDEKNRKLTDAEVDKLLYKKRPAVIPDFPS